jgi:predicted metal-dependent enzyme (double-stranded beta helix superfamily)
MFDLDQFIADCLAARGSDHPVRNIREVVARAVREPAAVLRCLGELRRSAMQKLYHEPGLTILNVVFGPGMRIPPHDHRMSAVIGIYTGREDNVFWRRRPGGRGGYLEPAGARSLSERDTAPLGPEIIHSVSNPLACLTGAIHVYSGDFFSAERSEWDPETLLERPFDAQAALRRFDAPNDYTQC